MITLLWGMFLGVGCNGGDIKQDIDDKDGDGHTVETDCDDTNAAINPEEPDEWVDGVDQNCDDFDGPDKDGDGYADDNAGGSDCDDEAASVNPEGIDGLLIDRNCDGIKAVGDLNLAEYTFFGESPDDYAGYWVSTAGDVDGDGLDDVLVGAYDEDETGESAGAAYLILGKHLREYGSFDIAIANTKFVGENAGDWAGFVVSSGNLDGDGLSDIIIGAYGTKDKGPITGSAYVIFGKNLSDGVFDLSMADHKFIGEKADDYAGYALSVAGDVDGDGLDDILIGASGHDAGEENTGAGYLIFASSLGSEKVIDLSMADYQFIGEAPDNWAGYSISDAGDVDGDGLADLILGADVDYGGTESHAAYVILGKSLGNNKQIELADADYILIGEESYDYASQVSSAGDVDGDGLADLIVGAAGHDYGGSSSGAAYIVLGSSLGNNTLIDLSQADYKLIGESADDFAGSTVANAGDVDGDGLGDVLVGALKHHSQHPFQGAAYIVLGSRLGAIQTIELSQADHRLVGDEKDYAGVSVAGAGDVDADGKDDILIGGYDGPTWRGIAYILLGG